MKNEIFATAFSCLACRSVFLRTVLCVAFFILHSSFFIQKSYAQPEGVRLDTLRVRYVDFEGSTQQGVIICNHSIANDLRDIFAELYRQHYPIERIRPISDYDDDDERSMQANNTSCYCYRPIAGTKRLSKHALGLAIDVNPLYNPCVRRKKDGTLLIQPSTGKPYADRSKAFKYKITRQDLCYQLFIQHGFRWGGAWRSVKDYQHFER